MRTTLLLLSAGLVLSLTLPCRAEFDSGGIVPTTAKGKQTTVAAFASGIAANSRPSSEVVANIRPFARVPVTAVPLNQLGCIVVVGPAPAFVLEKIEGKRPTIKNPSNIPRPKRGVIFPQRVFGGIE